MSLQRDIKALVDAGYLSPEWTVADLRGQFSLTDKYRDSYLNTFPANRSEPVSGRQDLGVGNHVANGQSALFLRIGTKDGALVFAVSEQSKGLEDCDPSGNEPERIDEGADELEEDVADAPAVHRAYTPVTEENNCKEDEDSYLSSVQDLLAQMRLLLGNGPPIAHCYRHRRPAYDWQCLGLLEAAAQYRFPIGNQRNFHAVAHPGPFDGIAANGRLVQHLQNNLRLARNTGNEVLAIQTAIDIQIWGGTNRGGHNEAAIRGASAQPEGFLGYLNLCERSFGTGTSVDLTPFIGSRYGIRSNAGYSKIYALAFDNFVIFDSRVMATLGLIVVRLLALQGLRNAAAPAGVAFLADNRGQDIARRDPNSNLLGIHGFPLTAGNNHVEHLQWNIRANALMVRSLPGSHFQTEVNRNPAAYPMTPLRALEAALFMIGYDLGCNWPHHH
jgi:hypothetical protein